MEIIHISWKYPRSVNIICILSVISLTFYSYSESDWCQCAARNYGPSFYDCQKMMRTTGQRDGRRKTQTYNLDWTPLGSSRHQCGDKCIATLDPTILKVIVKLIISRVLKILNTNTKIAKCLRTTRRADGWTYYTANKGM